MRTVSDAASDDEREASVVYIAPKTRPPAGQIFEIFEKY